MLSKLRSNEGPICTTMYVFGDLCDSKSSIRDQHSRTSLYIKSILSLLVSYGEVYKKKSVFNDNKKLFCPQTCWSHDDDSNMLISTILVSCVNGENTKFYYSYLLPIVDTETFLHYLLLLLRFFYFRFLETI